MARADPAGAVALLRTETAAAHEAVDAAFGRYALDDPPAYRSMLIAHARALPAAERALSALPFARTLPLRTPLLAADLAALDADLPAPLAWDAPADAAGLWGALYVVEGSRLGGVMIARGVPGDFPSAYLSAGHAPGQWQAIRAAVDANVAGERDRAAMLAGAHATFDLYQRAAAA